ncbi:hypothetical protein N7537_011570 [Penicillium hordei]|uniref:Uncharacterized protein n=1 Tax=Penicillium hordei TaxID=40994 RepID=A0AAD6DM36_9EURO|nr:uncharacterized protein N7537_011570 [Penicillium hordei]KAJ5588892.1 hypothetical protein N7537_011570 [Penicillium hordei]
MSINHYLSSQHTESIEFSLENRINPVVEFLIVLDAAAVKANPEAAIAKLTAEAEAVRVLADRTVAPAPLILTRVETAASGEAVGRNVDSEGGAHGSPTGGWGESNFGNLCPLRWFCSH